MGTFHSLDRPVKYAKAAYILISYALSADILDIFNIFLGNFENIRVNYPITWLVTRL